MKPEDKLITVKDPFAPERQALLQDLISSRKQTKTVSEKLKGLQIYIQDREQGWRIEREKLKQALHHQASVNKTLPVPPPPVGPKDSTSLSTSTTVLSRNNNNHFSSSLSSSSSSTNPNPEILELRAENERLRYRLTSYEHTLQSYATHSLLPSNTTTATNCDVTSTPSRCHRILSSSSDTRTPRTRRERSNSSRTPGDTLTATPSSARSPSITKRTWTSKTPTPTYLRQENDQLRHQVDQFVREKNEAVQLLTTITNEAKRNALLIQQLINRLSRYEPVTNITIPTYDHVSLPTVTVPPKQSVAEDSTSLGAANGTSSSSSSSVFQTKTNLVSSVTPSKSKTMYGGKASMVAKPVASATIKLSSGTVTLPKKTTVSASPVPPPYVKRTGLTENSTTFSKHIPSKTVKTSISKPSSSSSSSSDDIISMAKLLAEGKIDPDTLDETTRTTLLEQLQNMYSQQIIQTSHQLSNERGTVKVISMDLRKPDSSNPSSIAPIVRNVSDNQSSSTSIGSSVNNKLTSSSTTDFSVPVVPAWLANINKAQTISNSISVTSHPSNAVSAHIDTTPIRSFGT